MRGARGLFDGALEMKGMRLVVNGDDLGYTKANTLGIVEAYRRGILRSTTALGNSRYLGFAREAVEGCEGLGVGVHLTLTLGRPLTEGRSFAGADGAFLGRKELYAVNLDMAEVEAEWRAQIERFIEVMGRRPTHFDSHHGVHDFCPEALEVARGLAAEYGVELRRYGRFAYVSGFWDETATAETLIRIMREHAKEDVELMCHPGFCDLELYRESSYNVQRVRELDALCDERVLSYVKERGVVLCHY